MNTWYVQVGSRQRKRRTASRSRTGIPDYGKSVAKRSYLLCKLELIVWQPGQWIFGCVLVRWIVAYWSVTSRLVSSSPVLEGNSVLNKVASMVRSPAQHPYRCTKKAGEPQNTGNPTLSRTDDKIIDVAFDCGFKNLPYCYRRFKMQYGSTPVAYRKRSRRDIAP